MHHIGLETFFLSFCKCSIEHSKQNFWIKPRKNYEATVNLLQNEDKYDLDDIHKWQLV